MPDEPGKVLRLIRSEQSGDPSIGAALRRMAERADRGEIEGVLLFSTKNGDQGATHMLGELRFGSILELWERWKRSALDQCEEESPPEPDRL